MKLICVIQIEKRKKHTEKIYEYYYDYYYYYLCRVTQKISDALWMEIESRVFSIELHC